MIYPDKAHSSFNSNFTWDSKPPKGEPQLRRSLHISQHVTYLAYQIFLINCREGNEAKQTNEQTRVSYKSVLPLLHGLVLFFYSLSYSLVPFLFPDSRE